MPQAEFALRLRQLAEKTVAGCTFWKVTRWFGTQQTRQVFLPAGDEKYPSFWPIDAIFSARSGLLANEVLRDCICAIFAHGQNGDQPRLLENGLTVPPWAVADHINFDGGAVFFPGTYRSGTDQGNGSFGFLPPLNNLYLVTELVARYIAQSGDRAILEREFAGVSVKQRLKNAFFAPYALDEATDLCRSAEVCYAVDWTYCDQVKKNGLLLVPSVMRAEAAGLLAQLLPQEAEGFLTLQKKLVDSIVACFWDGEWFRSATGLGNQRDVWGTAYAVYSELLPKSVQEKACDALCQAYEQGSATDGGYVRHILTTDGGYWQACDSRPDSYMNGGYWATPSGWFAYALAQRRSTLAKRFAEEFLTHVEENEESGAPFEWFSPHTGKSSGCRYGTSGTALYAAVIKLKAQGVIL